MEAAEGVHDLAIHIRLDSQSCRPVRKMDNPSTQNTSRLPGKDPRRRTGRDQPFSDARQYEIRAAPACRRKSAELQNRNFTQA